MKKIYRLLLTSALALFTLSSLQAEHLMANHHMVNQANNLHMANHHMDNQANNLMDNNHHINQDKNQYINKLQLDKELTIMNLIELWIVVKELMFK